MYNYGICDQYDAEIFRKTCAIFDGIQGIKKKNLLIDVDETLIQIYRYQEIEIKIFNDSEVDAVFIESTGNISSLLEQYQIFYY